MQANNGVLSEFKTETVIFSYGDISPCMYLVKHGRVTLYRKGDHGDDVKLKFLEKGAYFGVISFLGEVPRRYKAVADPYTQVEIILENGLESYIKENSNSMVVLMEDMSKRLVRANKSLGRMGGLNKCPVEEAQAEHSPESQGKPVAVRAANKEHLMNDLSHPAYPKGHKHYDKGLAVGHEEKLFEKNVTCPVCEKEFTLFQMKTSKLKLRELRRDMRQVFEDLDELWYNVWSCPHCKYSNFYYAFLKLISTKKELLREALPEKLKDFKLPETQKTSFNEVFDSYYLLLANMEILDAGPYVMGKIWLHLAWLYEDCDDKEMFDMAYEKAREHYAKGWFSERVVLKPDAEQKLALLMAELHEHAGMYKEAQQYTFEAIQHKKGSVALTKMAKDRLMELKEKVKAQTTD